MDSQDVSYFLILCEYYLVLVLTFHIFTPHMHKKIVDRVYSVYYLFTSSAKPVGLFCLFSALYACE
jgi:hypothetical protein